MTFEEIKAIAEVWFELPDTSALLFARDMYERGQTAERERIKGRVKEAAEIIWSARDLVDNRYGLYIGPPLNTMEQFVEKLMEE